MLRALAPLPRRNETRARTPPRGDSPRLAERAAAALVHHTLVREVIMQSTEPATFSVRKPAPHDVAAVPGLHAPAWGTQLRGAAHGVWTPVFLGRQKEMTGDGQFR